MCCSVRCVLVPCLPRCSENSREFGILRAIGLDVGQVTRVYLYEAVAVVLSSFSLGTIIGEALVTAACLLFPFAFNRLIQTIDLSIDSLTHSCLVQGWSSPSH
jgi:ABC-type antimicrobial peptide transport system permease subunit